MVETVKVPYDTELPPEVEVILGESGDLDKIGELYPRPQVERERSRGIVEVDAVEVMEPFLSDDRFDGTIREGDVLNGCLWQCDFCHADTLVPDMMFSLSSWNRLWQRSDFLTKLHRDKFRIGVAGDLGNHHHPVLMTKTVLRATERFFGDDYRVFVLMNFRPWQEAVRKLDGLLNMALMNPRLGVIVSTPNNIDWSTRDAFTDFVLDRDHIFEVYNAGERTEEVYSRVDNVSIHDLPYTGNVGLGSVDIVGRVAPEIVESDKYKYANPDDPCDYRASVDEWFGIESRGLSRVYMGPDGGLWLSINATSFQSHTRRIFTPISEANMDVLMKLPLEASKYEAEAICWPGGVREKYSASVVIMIMGYEEGNGEQKPLTYRFS